VRELIIPALAGFCRGLAAAPLSRSACFELRVGYPHFHFGRKLTIEALGLSDVDFRTIQAFSKDWDMPLS
jgi:hypothetical protein